MSTNDMPAYPLGSIPIPVGRAYLAVDQRGNKHTVMVLAVSHGSGKADDGAKVRYMQGGNTMLVQFEYPDDTPDERDQQKYDVNIADIVEALHELNKRRRAGKFLDAPALKVTVP